MSIGPKPCTFSKGFVLVKYRTIKKLQRKFLIHKLLYNGISLNLVLEIHNIIISYKVGKLVRSLYERVLVLNEVGLRCSEMLQLDYSQVRRNEAVATHLVSKGFSDQLLVCFAVYED